MSKKAKTLEYQPGQTPIFARRRFLTLFPAIAAALISVGFSTLSKWIAQKHEGSVFLDGSPHYDLYLNLIDNIPAIILTSGVFLGIAVLILNVVRGKLPIKTIWFIAVFIVIWCVAGFIIGLNSLDIS